MPTEDLQPTSWYASIKTAQTHLMGLIRLQMYTRGWEGTLARGEKDGEVGRKAGGGDREGLCHYFSISFISGRWEGDTEGLCADEPVLV